MAADNTSSLAKSDGSSVFIGQQHNVDVYDAGEDPSNKEYGYTSMRFAYDEISETNAHIMLLPDRTGHTLA